MPPNLQDCQMIIRAFEKGCAWSTDQRAVFAPMTGYLQDAQSFSKAVSSLSKDVTADVVSQVDRELAQEERAGKKAHVETDDNSNKAKSKVLDWLKECVPCQFKINFKAELDFNWRQLLDALYNNLLGWLLRFLEQIRELIEMLMGLFKKIDPCAFFNFLFDWVCLPDLYKILAALTALLFNIGAFLDGLGLDLVLSLIVPILLPFLMAILSLVERFLLLILEPLKCIIESAIRFVDKLDWGGLQLPTKFTIRGPSFIAGSISAVAGSGDSRVPSPEHKFGYEYQFNLARDIGLTDEPTTVAGEGSFSLGVPLPAEDKDPAWSFSTDFGGATEKFNAWNKEQLQAWREERNKFTSAFRSFISDLVLFIRTAMNEFRGKVKAIVEEIQKIMEEYLLGFSVNIGKACAQKLAILQIVSFIIAVIKFLKDRPDCTPEDREGMVFGLVSDMTKQFDEASGYVASQNEDGTISIVGPAAATTEVAQLLAGASGVSGASNGLSGIFKTGVGVVDAEIANIVEKMTTPVNVVYGCPRSLTKMDVEDINSWLTGVASK